MFILVKSVEELNRKIQDLSVKIHQYGKGDEKLVNKNVDKCV